MQSTRIDQEFKKLQEIDAVIEKMHMFSKVPRDDNVQPAHVFRDDNFIPSGGSLQDFEHIVNSPLYGKAISLKKLHIHADIKKVQNVFNVSIVYYHPAANVVHILLAQDNFVAKHEMKKKGRRFHFEITNVKKGMF